MKSKMVHIMPQHVAVAPFAVEALTTSAPRKATIARLTKQTGESLRLEHSRCICTLLSVVVKIVMFAWNPYRTEPGKKDSGMRNSIGFGNDGSDLANGKLHMKVNNQARNLRSALGLLP